MSKGLFTHPKESFGALEFADASEFAAEDPRFGPDWKQSWWATEHPLGLEGLAYVSVVVDDVDAARTFYCDVLGGSVRLEHRSALIRADVVEIDLGRGGIVALESPYDDDSQLARDLEANGSMVHSVAWKVANLEQAKRYLQQQQVAIAVSDHETLVADETTTLGFPTRFTAFDRE